MTLLDALRSCSRLAVLVAAIFFLGACDSAERDDSGQIVDGGNLDVFTIKLGDCFQDGDASEVEDVDAVPCSRPHDNEVYHLFKLGGSRYPGDAEIELAADEGCLAAFASYVGTAYEESRLEFSWLTPTETSWTEVDDREVVCVLYDAEFERLTGSMKNSRE